MPRLPHQMSLARQWEMLQIIPTRGQGLSAREIRDELEDLDYPVTKRTVERDLDELSRVFSITCNDLTRPYRWKWTHESAQFLPGLHLVDAVSLIFVEKYLQEALPQALFSGLAGRFRQAHKLLRASEREQTRPVAGALQSGVPDHVSPPGGR